jgi:hypothetical protein
MVSAKNIASHSNNLVINGVKVHNQCGKLVVGGLHYVQVFTKNFSAGKS